MLFSCYIVLSHCWAPQADAPDRPRGPDGTDGPVGPDEPDEPDGPDGPDGPAGPLSEPYAKKPKKEPFTKLDFSAVVLHHRLLTPNAVLEHMFEKGSKAMQLWVHCRQRKLKEFIQDALDMEAAKPAAALEKESDWSLVERLCQCMYIWAAFSRRAKTAKKKVNLLLLKEPRLQKKVSIYYW